ncbi:hypothetical protein AwDysgo_10750 [Bacteroidales bacterium]|nr:hypothetical protein AwDysgo_10750 [Bacteroidales bacterium]
MLQIEDTIISLDILEEMFCCDLSQCKGECCIEGESGAPVANEEIALLEAVLPIVWDDLSPAAQELINTQGVTYIDQDDGEHVTSIVNGKDCVFTTYTKDGTCICAIEKAFRAGKTDFYKPISCHLYPIRLTKHRDFTAVNYHRWSVCKPAIAMGRREGIRVYQFLEEPLIRKFGKDWHEQLCIAAKEFYSQEK